MLILAVLISGCAVGGSDSDDDRKDETRQEGTFRISATTSSRGIATVTFDLPEGTTKFGITALLNKSDLRVRFTALADSRGTDYLSPRGTSLSFANLFARYANSTVAPSRRQDPPIVDGERYTATVEVESTSGSRAEGETVNFEVITKADPGLDGGRLRINLYYVGRVGQEQSTRDVIRAALGTFRSTYSSQLGIDLDISEFDIDGPVVLPSPFAGDRFYRDAAGIGQSPAVNIFLGGDVDATLPEGTILGLAGSIPAPPTPTERSALAVSLFGGAGPDGRYSAEDTRLLGETLAHETGHYTGLFHPVDISGGIVTNVDPLDDTPTCSFLTECLSDKSLITNLMFPSPITDNDGRTIPQNRLTSDQRGVVNRYIVTD